MQVLDSNKLCCNVCNKHYTKKSSLDRHLKNSNCNLIIQELNKQKQILLEQESKETKQMDMENQLATNVDNERQIREKEQRIQAEEQRIKAEEEQLQAEEEHYQRLLRQHEESLRQQILEARQRAQRAWEQAQRVAQEQQLIAQRAAQEASEIASAQLVATVEKNMSVIINPQNAEVFDIRRKQYEQSILGIREKANNAISSIKIPQRVLSYEEIRSLRLRSMEIKKIILDPAILDKFLILEAKLNGSLQQLKQQLEQLEQQQVELSLLPLFCYKMMVTIDSKNLERPSSLSSTISQDKGEVVLLGYMCNTYCPFCQYRIVPSLINPDQSEESVICHTRTDNIFACYHLSCFKKSFNTGHENDPETRKPFASINPFFLLLKPNYNVENGSGQTFNEIKRYLTIKPGMDLKGGRKKRRTIRKKRRTIRKKRRTISKKGK